MTIGILDVKCLKSQEMKQIVEVDRASECFVPRNRINSNVNRCLFGPVDHDETLAFLQNQMKKIQIEKSQKWGFDFVNEKPLTPPTNFTWERIDSVPHSSSTSSSSEDRIPKIVDNEVTSSQSADSCSIKYKQTTINQYWSCTKRNINSTRSRKCQNISSKRKLIEDDVDNNLSSSNNNYSEHNFEPIMTSPTSIDNAECRKPRKKLCKIPASV